MSANNPKHKRRSIRLPEYDYSQGGAYYITICTQDRKCLFGEIADGQMKLNPYGEIADQCWRAIPQHFANVLLGEYVIMPNHIHGTIIITEPPVGTRHAVSLPSRALFGKPQIGSLSTIIRSYKSAVTRQINLIRAKNEPAIWQGRFYEHVIRNDKSYDKIKQYIIENHLYWAQDDENPNRGKTGS
jgi:REP element-mobilizing transposase RayT